MGTTAVKMRIMPSSPETDMKEVEKKITEKMEEEGVKNPLFEIQPVAFGLNSLIALFAWPEEKELEKLEESLRKIDSVNSVEVIDMRRAIG